MIEFMKTVLSLMNLPPVLLPDQCFVPRLAPKVNQKIINVKNYSRPLPASNYPRALMMPGVRKTGGEAG